MRTAGLSPLFLLVGVFASGCERRSFVPLIPDETLELAALAIGPNGETFAATPLRDATAPLEIELPVGPDLNVVVLGFDPGDFAELDAQAAANGFDGRALRRAEAIRIAAGCEARYPQPRRAWRLEGEAFVALAAETFEIGSTWLDRVCPWTDSDAPEGFVDNQVILSDCAACPPTQLQRTEQCRGTLQQISFVCGLSPGTTELRVDWRGDICAEDGGACQSLGGARLGCADSCELELALGGFEAQDRFATSTVILDALSPDEARIWGFAVLDTRIVRGVGAASTCAEGPNGAVHLEFWTLDGERQQNIPLSGCRHLLAGVKEDGTFLVISAPEEPDREWRFDLYDRDGEIVAAHIEDLERLFAIGPLDDLYLGTTNWWPEKGGWVLLPLLARRQASAPGMFLELDANQSRLTLGPNFEIPEGTLNAAVHRPKDGPSSLWVLSAASLAILAEPLAPAIFRSTEPLPGESPSRAKPTSQRLGDLDAVMWSAGSVNSVASIWRVEPDGGPVAFLSNPAGGARTLFRLEGQTLLLTHAPEGIFVTRFDFDGWRPIPGTIKLDGPGRNAETPLLETAQWQDGPLYVATRDGRVLRVNAP